MLETRLTFLSVPLLASVSTPVPTPKTLASTAYLVSVDSNRQRRERERGRERDRERDRERQRERQRQRETERDRVTDAQTYRQTHRHGRGG